MKTRFRSIMERVLSYGLIVLAIGGLIYFQTHVNRFQKDSIADKKKELATLEDQIIQANDQLKKRKDQVAKIQAQVPAKTKDLKEKFETLLEKSKNYTEFIKEVQREANDLDIKILNSKYDPPSPVKGAGIAYLEFRFNLSVTGPYDKMKHFLWKMENALGRIVRITKMDIRPPICDKDGNMSIILTLATYFLP